MPPESHPPLRTQPPASPTCASRARASAPAPGGASDREVLEPRGAQPPASPALAAGATRARRSAPAAGATRAPAAAPATGAAAVQLPKKRGRPPQLPEMLDDEGDFLREAFLGREDDPKSPRRKQLQQDAAAALEQQGKRMRAQAMRPNEKRRFNIGQVAQVALADVDRFAFFRCPRAEV